MISVVGFAFHACLLLVLVTWRPTGDDPALFHVISAAWGVCNSIWETLIYSKYEILILIVNKRQTVLRDVRKSGRWLLETSGTKLRLSRIKVSEVISKAPFLSAAAVSCQDAAPFASCAYITNRACAFEDIEQANGI